MQEALGEPKGALFIGETNWNASMTSYTQNTYATGYPVAIIQANNSEINQLRTVVGLPGGFNLPDSLFYFDVYGLDHDDQGDIFEIGIIKPQANESATFIIYNTDGSILDTKIADRDESTDYQQDKQSRVDFLREWIAENETRDMYGDAVRAKADTAIAKAEETKKLHEIANEWRAKHVFLTGEKELKDHLGLVAMQGCRNLPKNIHTVNTSVWTVYNKETDEYWFYVEQIGMLNASKQNCTTWCDSSGCSTIEDEDKNYAFRGIYTYQYKLNSYINGMIDNVDAPVSIVERSPATTENKTSVTNNMSFNLSGKLSFSPKFSKGEKTSGDLGGSAEISGGITIGQSRNYEIKDVNILNQCGSRANNASWEYNIAKPWIAWNPLGIKMYGPTPNVGKATFEPKMQWLWKVNASVRGKYPDGLPITIEFSTLTGSVVTSPFLFIPVEGRYRSGVLSANMTVKWPPKTAK